MRIRRRDDQTVELSGIDLLCCELLRQIVVSGQVDDFPAARERLYSSPSHGREPEFDQDWKDYVEPDLRDMFRTSREVVQAALKNFPPKKPADSYTLNIPVKHLEAWIHALNQARLALSARFNFTEHEMEDAIPIEGDQRALALFQVHFYGFLQECFLRQLED
ncbi:MAG TPA: DUF2017 family protein [Chthoniobacteraceae bacterium]|jgi:hypothetical protein|nr:DUF2017 family protein [Chthoniobacteraceae bacterium]